MKEPESGIFKVDTSSNVIIVELIGLFNESGTIKANMAIKEAIEALSGQGFFLIIDICKLEGGTPEGWAEREKFNVWLQSQAMIEKLTVIKSRAMASIMESRIPSRQHENKNTFFSITDALNWIEESKV